MPIQRSGALGRHPSFAVIISLLLIAMVTTTSHASSSRPIITGGNASDIHISSGSFDAAKAATDSFYIYGGPGSVLGKFQTTLNPNSAEPDPQGWTSVDNTENESIWHASQINVEPLGAPNNWGVIAHHEGPDYFGYGNNWNEWLTCEVDVAALGYDPEVDSVDLRLVLDYTREMETGYDYFRVNIRRSSGYQELARFTGGHADSALFAFEFDSDSVGGVTLDPVDYFEGKIHLRLSVTSDGAWSDEDGFYPTEGDGAAAVDNIELYIDDLLVSLADWTPQPGHVDFINDHPEGDIDGHSNGASPFVSGWEPTPSAYVGDFAKLFVGVQTIDPCRSNLSPVWGFIDDGTPPANSPFGESTGGSTSSNWSYGVPGGYVVNYTGGLTEIWSMTLDNEIWSPPIDVDLPGVADDVANGGFQLNYTVYEHLPLLNAMFAVWHVRGYTTADGWADWRSAGFLYSHPDPKWVNRSPDVSRLLPAAVEQVQISLGLLDLAGLFDFPGTDATPSPLFDNVSLQKYRIPGPQITARSVELMSDGFPNDQTLTGSIRWDACIDIGFPGDALTPGDSLALEISPLIPGSSIVDPPGGVGGVLRAAIVCNPDFGDVGSGARSAGLAAANAALVGVVTDSSDPRFAWQIYETAVPGQQVFDSGGGIRENRYFWDLPDGAPNVNAPHQLGVDVAGVALFFPGDVIHYYIEASDDLANRTTLPHDITGYLDFTASSPYDRNFTTRGLPTAVGGGQPEILWWNDFGHQGGEDEWILAMAQNGLIEGQHFDTYTTKAASSGEGNGLGSSPHHGAAPAQMAGYDCVIYTAGNLSSDLISDGTDSGSNSKSDDIRLLSAWHEQSAPRAHVYFGDRLVYGMMNAGTEAQAYVQGVIGASSFSPSVGPKIQGQTAPVIQALAGAACGSFATDYVAYGGCFALNKFGDIQAADPSVIPLHEFTDSDGSPYPTSVPASLYWARDEGGFEKKTIVFAHDLLYVRDVLNRPGGAASARTYLLGEVLDCFGKSGFGPPTDRDAVSPARFAVEANHPNPFNPKTTIAFRAPAAGKLSLRIYDTRGRLVARQERQVDAGAGHLEWDGRDADGASVASGVYPYELVGFGESHRGRMLLLK